MHPAMVIVKHYEKMLSVLQSYKQRLNYADSSKKMFTLAKFKMFYQRTLKKQTTVSKHESRPMTQLA